MFLWKLAAFTLLELLAHASPPGLHGEVTTPPPPNASGHELLCALRDIWSPDPIRPLDAAHAVTWDPFGAKPGSTCAVISSSGALAVVKHGAEIDRADHVFRFNMAPIEGYEEFVGSTEDIRVWNGIYPHLDRSDKVWKWGPEPMYLQFPDSTDHIQEIQEAHQQDSGVKFYVYDPESPYGLRERVQDFFFEHYADAWFPDQARDETFNPSTGTMGMLVALGMCGTVRAYGFATSEVGMNDSLPFHYFQDDAINQGRNANSAPPVHKMFHAEKDVWRRLASNPLEEIDSEDIAVITGFSNLNCDTTMAETTTTIAMRESPARKHGRFAGAGSTLSPAAHSTEALRDSVESHNGGNDAKVVSDDEDVEDGQREAGGIFVTVHVVGWPLVAFMVIAGAVGMIGGYCWGWHCTQQVGGGAGDEPPSAWIAMPLQPRRHTFRSADRSV